MLSPTVPAQDTLDYCFISRDGGDTMFLAFDWLQSALDPRVQVGSEF
jgi:hypothetical protein